MGLTRLRHHSWIHNASAPVHVSSRSCMTEGGLVTALDEWAPTPATGFFLYYPSRRQMRPALKAFVDFLRKERHGAQRCLSADRERR